jgi:hypothetical protein
MSEPQAATFQIEKIYIKDMSLEIPNAPHVFMEQNKPQLVVRIDSGATPFAEGHFEVTVTATVTARAPAHAVLAEFPGGTSACAVPANRPAARPARRSCSLRARAISDPVARRISSVPLNLISSSSSTCSACRTNWRRPRIEVAR